MNKNLIIYYIICLKYNDNLTNFNLLSEIRKSFFTTNKRQKNKITKKFENKIYYYSYDLDFGKPMSWKKMYNNKILEKSRQRSHDSYEVVFYDENKIFKIIYFDLSHKIKKIEYFNIKNINKKITLDIIDNKLFVSENDGCFLNKQELYCLNTDLQNNCFETLSQQFTTFLCFTNEGILTYSTNNQNNIIKNYKNENLNLNMFDNFNCKKIIKTESNDIFYYFGEMLNMDRNGLGFTINDLGKLAYSGNYLNDKKDGFGVFYNKNGNVSYIGNFKQGQKNKLGITFNKNYNQININLYNNGKLTKNILKIDLNGNILNKK